MQKEEQWKPIKELEEVYHISNHGRVKSFARDKVNGLIISPRIKKQGYYLYIIRFKGQIKAFYAHRKVGEYFVPNPDNLPCVDHIKNDKSLNCAWDLQWMEHKENVRKDQAKPIICVSPLGDEIEAAGTRHAAEIASCHRQSVVSCLKTKGSTITGWSFKYKKK